MSGPDPSDRWTNVLAWLRIAAPDERAARICLAAEPPLPDVAAYRCQQAGEKILKGFLVLADTDFRRTPDLDEFRRSVMLRFPDVAALVAPIGAWTVWGVEHRDTPAKRAPSPNRRRTCCPRHWTRLPDWPAYYARQGRLARCPTATTGPARPDARSVSRRRTDVRPVIGGAREPGGFVRTAQAPDPITPARASTGPYRASSRGRRWRRACPAFAAPRPRRSGPWRGLYR